MTDKELMYFNEVMGIYDDKGAVEAIDYLGVKVLEKELTSAECRKIMCEVVLVWQQEKGIRKWI